MNQAIESVKKYVRAANYLTAAQIYLQDNFFLERPLAFSDIKPRLLGHWGTCPGINFIYANLNRLVKTRGMEMLFILGPGHGFPALQANLFLEETLGEYYPQAARDEKGIGYLCRNFSWPYGFPSHSNPGTPGVILEGGELGYALATAYGAALDNPELLVACVIGDGEAETGPTAAAWHLNKFVNPKNDGAVLPVLHLNGYKISGPTIFGRMSDEDLRALFTGYGYRPIIVSGKDIYRKMSAALESSHRSIKAIQKNARDGKSAALPRFPMIILRTPKGWTGIKKLRGKRIEGNCLSHQVVATNAKSDAAELKAVENWLKSYHFGELFNAETGFIKEIRDAIPSKKLRMGNNRRAFAGKIRRDLFLPDPKKFAEDASKPGAVGSSSMRRAGLYLNDVFKLNAKNKNFRLMSPDETYSNKLDAIFQTTKRAFALPVKPWDRDLAPDGRVMEILSEHCLQGLVQGYILTGRHAVFASYEAFIQIVASMADQYAKFLKAAREIPWRRGMPSLNYILTSSGWRQEHNGFSHQNPGFIGNLLEKEGCFINVYFPPDGNSALAVLDHCLRSQDEINVIVAGKTLEPRWLTIAEARRELERGLMIWDFASDKNPDIVFAAVGDYMTKEALAAIDYLKRALPKTRIRFVNVIKLSALGGIGDADCRPPVDFNKYFTADKPVIFNFHGSPETLKALLVGQKNPGRFSVRGYIENGSTTTPFDMQARNETSRFHLAIEALRLLAASGRLAGKQSASLIKELGKKLRDHAEYAKKHGVDPEETENWQWKRKS